jgi:hypothetical protein
LAGKGIARRLTAFGVGLRGNSMREIPGLTRLTES